MMTRDQQVKKALKFLASTSAACREEIETSLNVVEVMEATAEYNKAMVSKDTKRKFGVFVAALRKAKATHNALPDEFRDLFKLDLKNIIENAERWSRRPSVAPKRTAHKQRLAVKQALWLLQHYNRPHPATRDGDWCKLAAILYGNQTADLYHFCCEEIERPYPG